MVDKHDWQIVLGGHREVKIYGPTDNERMKDRGATGEFCCLRVRQRSSSVRDRGFDDEFPRRRDLGKCPGAEFVRVFVKLTFHDFATSQDSELHALAPVDLADSVQLVSVVRLLQPPVVIALGFNDLNRSVGEVSAEVGEVHERLVLPGNGDNHAVRLAQATHDGLIHVTVLEQRHFVVGFVWK